MSSGTTHWSVNIKGSYRLLCSNIQFPGGGNFWERCRNVGGGGTHEWALMFYRIVSLWYPILSSLFSFSNIPSILPYLLSSLSPSLLSRTCPTSFWADGLWSARFLNGSQTSHYWVMPSVLWCTIFPLELLPRLKLIFLISFLLKLFITAIQK